MCAQVIGPAPDYQTLGSIDALRAFGIEITDQDIADQADELGTWPTDVCLCGFDPEHAITRAGWTFTGPDEYGDLQLVEHVA